MGRHAKWTPAMDAVLREVYPHRGGKACANRLGMRVEQVWARADKLDLTSPRGRGEAWTPDEDEILREHFTGAGAAGCVALLKGRTLGAVQTRACHLGLCRRIGADGRTLIEAHDHRALAEALGMNGDVPPSIARLPARIHRLGGGA